MNNFLVALVRNLRVFVSMYKNSNNYAYPQVICEEIKINRLKKVDNLSKCEKTNNIFRILNAP